MIEIEISLVFLSWGILGITSRWSMWTEGGGLLLAVRSQLNAGSQLQAGGGRAQGWGGWWEEPTLKLVDGFGINRAGCSKFHSGIVLGKKKECLYGSVEVRIVLYLNWWQDLVLESALSNKSWWGTDMISWMILKSRARRICFRLSFNCCQPRSDNIWVTLLRGLKSWHTKRAAHRCTRSSLSILYSWCGSHVPAAYSNFWSY